MIIHRVDESGFGVKEHSPEDVRALVYALEGELKRLPQVEISIEHEFAFGLYTRKIFIPAGHALTGRLHKQDDFQIVFSGDISILTENGMKRFIGPATFTSKAGVKPFAYAHSDTHYATVHHTHLTDLEEIEKELFEDEASMFDFVSGKVLQEALPCRQPSQ